MGIWLHRESSRTRSRPRLSCFHRVKNTRLFPPCHVTNSQTLELSFGCRSCPDQSSAAEIKSPGVGTHLPRGALQITTVFLFHCSLTTVHTASHRERALCPCSEAPRPVFRPASNQRRPEPSFASPNSMPAYSESKPLCLQELAWEARLGRTSAGQDNPRHVCSKQASPPARREGGKAAFSPGLRLPRRAGPSWRLDPARLGATGPSGDTCACERRPGARVPRKRRAQPPPCRSGEDARRPSGRAASGSGRAAAGRTSERGAGC